MKEGIAKIDSVSQTIDGDVVTISRYLLRPVALETGVKGCQIKTGDVAKIIRNSPIIKLLTRACLSCQLRNDCKIKSI